MTAHVLTDAGSPIPAELMEKWCQMWADGDRRLRADEIALNVLGRRPATTPGQLWERLYESTDPHPESADSHADQAEPAGVENHADGSH